jgi:MFS family permease
VLAQFAGTSPWFAGNAVIGNLFLEGNTLSIGWITSLVQIGFILGTLVYALRGWPDRYAPTLVFLLSSVCCAAANLSLIAFPSSEAMTILFRILTGFFLAGIYPVGMKIAADWNPGGLGRSLGFLVGALVLGTAFPHLLNAGIVTIHWKAIFIITSLMCLLSGLVTRYVIGDGPAHVYQKAIPRWSDLRNIFRDRSFRSAAFGYFGHMWELYTFWAFVPLIIVLAGVESQAFDLLIFYIIALGAVGCMAGGVLSGWWGHRRIAIAALFLSGSCCLASPWALQLAPHLLVPFLLAWGFAVVADSPQFSALVAKHAPGEQKGTALSIVISIGFSITIVSIQCLEWLAFSRTVPLQYVFLFLLPGPVFGLWAMCGGIQKKAGG